MKKNRILLLCLFALISIVVLVSCFQEDPIKDNRVIGTWTATVGQGTFTLEAKADQTFVWTKTVGSVETIVKGTWEASSVSEGIFKKDGVQYAGFTAYGDVMYYYDAEYEKIEFRHPKQ
ncbi:MAG: hypothetical protein II493_03750 [Spirochaetales bacterium]|nr:hypothetical protein [Spirochaetales bacterium]